MNLEQALLQQVQDILLKNYGLTSHRFVLLVYDLNCTLSRLLASAYQTVIKNYAHKAINVETIAEDDLIDAFNSLPPHSIVILVQTSSFRTTKYRLRADLFRLGHQVIEHARLGHNTDDQIETYLHSLKYDTPYYMRTCNAIEKLLELNLPLRVESRAESGEGLVLTADPPFEKVIKNTGDFTGNPTASTGFPIGEVFTEASRLDALNGSVLVFGFPTVGHLTEFTEPFTVTIKAGGLVNHTGPSLFEEIIQLIKAEEQTAAVPVREIGFGLNRALGFEHRLREPTSFERFCGMHLSLGLKHNMYRKKMSRKIVQKYHVDIFCLVDRVFIGDRLIFEKGKYLV